MEEKRYCLECGKQLIKKVGQRRLNPRREYCEPQCQQSKFIKSWYKKNKGRQLRNVMNNYKRNKLIWRERTLTNTNREKVLSFLPNKCHFCKKELIKIIHHINYGNYITLIRSKGKEAQKENLIRLKKYTKENLLGFCSMKCHRNFESVTT